MAATAAESNVFGDPFYKREVDQWLQRAEPEDKERFHRVFDVVQAYPDTIEGAAAKLEETKRAAQMASARFKPGSGKPPTPKSGEGWVYNATRAALRKASPPVTMQTPLPERVPTPAPSTPDQQQQAGSRPRSAPNNRELRALMNAHKSRRPPTASRSASGSPQEAPGTPAAAPTMQKSPVVTTYQMAFHVQEDNPELYARALENARADPVPNYSLISDWGDTLKRGVDEVWRQKFMKSTYTSSNEDVVKEVTNFDVLKEQAFFEWMQKQDTYYGDLLTKLKKEDMRKLFSAGSLEERREILEALRQVYAVVQPDHLKSHSQSVHRPMVRTEDDQLLLLLREQTKLKTMGRPPPVVRPEDLPPPGQSMPPLVLPTAQQMHQQSIRERDDASGSEGAGPAVQHHWVANEEGRGMPVRTLSGTKLPPRPSTSARQVDLVFQPNAQLGRPLSRPGTPSGNKVFKRPGSASGPAANGQDTLKPLSTLVTQQAGRLNGQRPATAQAAFGASPRASVPKVDARSMIETQKSKVPLQWSAASIAPVSTAYEDAFGGLSQIGGSPRRALSASAGPIKYREVTCPIGAVNKHTAMAPIRDVYAVPECYVQKLPFPMPNGDVTMDTTNRITFAPRAEADVMRSMAAAAEMTEQSKKRLYKSTIPLGKNGLVTTGSDQWKSEVADNYVKHMVDLEADKARAAGLKKYLNGPTAATGKLTATHAEANAAWQQLAATNAAR
mmetsp:Transcript_23489/g.51554  ORF Transcript_23489/g.51554 Transcript_23489/m.51554 type:complete len:728 (-) Transcript_23489:764-2947(-)|eukprot:CAMPEP_0202893886 /NCGR_PEP_ID=MMETSP1392-20130828/3377_1 /ASSEMBLY_ACC=CAM_ASM_000868 /TAXON_ID=225041 /ORGANISM="Chlamydomonas chlamydogama, Strain SAG 11-48b" /LENGTH=727 /DNA_ID=CAMNT_0049578379 /DNA_START=298 /DNA_END=2481 /DNA_ORIENTATION=-